MTTQASSTEPGSETARVSDSDIRLARALARSFERDHQEADERLLAIAALPLPEDRGAA